MPAKFLGLWNLGFLGCMARNKDSGTPWEWEACYTFRNAQRWWVRLDLKAQLQKDWSCWQLTLLKKLLAPKNVWLKLSRRRQPRRRHAGVFAGRDGAEIPWRNARPDLINSLILKFHDCLSSSWWNKLGLQCGNWSRVSGRNCRSGENSTFPSLSLCPPLTPNPCASPPSLSARLMTGFSHLATALSSSAFLPLVS